MPGELPWPERIAAVLIALEGFLFVLFSIGNPHVGTPDWALSLFQLWKVPLFTVGPIWLLLRVIDWAIDGPARRKVMALSSSLRG